jgi:hypothetical protein
MCELFFSFMCVRVEPWPEIFYALVLLPQSMQGKAAGQHGYCDHCVWFKKELKKFQTSASRVELMDKYAKHLLQNWRDRQFDSSLHAQSCQTRESILAGTPLSSMSHSVPGQLLLHMSFV